MPRALPLLVFFAGSLGAAAQSFERAPPASPLVFSRAPYNANENCSDPRYALRDEWRSPNATGMVTVDGFAPPDGSLNPAGRWSWSIAVSASPAIEQELWLDTSPEKDLISSDSRYIGCVLLIIGLPLETSSKGKGDDGTCSSIMSQSCMDGLTNTIKQSASSLGAVDMSLDQKCSQLTATFSVPPDCQNATGHSQGFVGSAFAGAQINSSECVSNTGAGNSTYPIVGWGQYGADKGDNHTFYDEAVNSVTPMLSVYFDANGTQDNGYSDARLTCLRPTTIAAGSRTPTSGASSHLSNSWFAGLLGVAAGVLMI